MANTSNNNINAKQHLQIRIKIKSPNQPNSCWNQPSQTAAVTSLRKMCHVQWVEKTFDYFKMPINSVSNLDGGWGCVSTQNYPRCACPKLLESLLIIFILFIIVAIFFKFQLSVRLLPTTLHYNSLFVLLTFFLSELLQHFSDNLTKTKNHVQNYSSWLQ